MFDINDIREKNAAQEDGYWKRAVDWLLTVLDTQTRGMALLNDACRRAQEEARAARVMSTMIEDRHNAWVAAERELEAARAVVEAAGATVDYYRERAGVLIEDPELDLLMDAVREALDAARRAGE